MMLAVEYYGRFRQMAVERGIPNDEVSRFAELLRFVIGTSTTPSGAPVGQIGGLPRLPVGMEWPSSGDTPLPFVASFDCAALPRVDGLDLPADGSLLIFLHHEEAVEVDSMSEEQSYARVVYLPAGVAAEEPAEPEQTGQMFYKPREFVESKHLLFPTVYAQWPEWLESEENNLPEFQRQLARELPHRRQLCALAAELWPKRWAYHPHIGGYPPSIEWRFREYVNAIEDVRTSSKITATPGGLAVGESVSAEEEEHRLMQEWVSLVRFRADDVHAARFLIHREDLAAGRLDKALSCTEFLE